MRISLQESLERLRRRRRLSTFVDANADANADAVIRIGVTSPTWSVQELTELVEDAEAERLRGFHADVCGLPATPVPRDLPLRARDGSVLRLESAFNNLLDDPNVAGVVVTARDVTERRRLEAELEHQAFHDSLTGLANRALFANRVEHALERGARRGSTFAVLLIDLDDFKLVNDSLGHAAGDELLVLVARRLESCLRPEDTCARLGGDEFAILIEGLAGPEDAMSVSQRVLRAIGEPLVVLGTDVVVHGSVGIALASGGESVSEILRSADLAMYSAKNQGKSRFAVFEPAMHEDVTRRLAVKAELERSVAEDELEVHYRPILALETGAVAALEAVVRWRHPERGLVAPGDVVALAEEAGLAVALGRVVLGRACRDLRGWRELGLAGLGVSVDLRAQHLASDGVVADVTAALRAAALEPSALVLELAESPLLDDRAAAGRLEELERLGVRIAIDGFGTGHSSLDLLRRLPVHALKIGKPFADRVAVDSGQERFARAVVQLASTLGLDTIVDGVEEPSQRERLRDLGFAYGQGPLFSPALPADEVAAFLRGPRLVA